jgi:hypothetical protein
MKTTIRILSVAAFSAAAATAGWAKLPPPTPEAKAKAAEAAAKADWTNKLGAFQLCQAMNKVALRYQSETRAAGKEVMSTVSTPPCSDPGPFVYVAKDEGRPPIEAAGAHSPPKTATAPPSSKESASELPPKK